MKSPLPQFFLNFAIEVHLFGAGLACVYIIAVLISLPKGGIIYLFFIFIQQFLEMLQFITLGYIMEDKD